MARAPARRPAGGGNHGGTMEFRCDSSLQSLTTTKKCLELSHCSWTRKVSPSLSHPCFWRGRRLPLDDSFIHHFSVLYTRAAYRCTTRAHLNFGPLLLSLSLPLSLADTLVMLQNQEKHINKKQIISQHVHSRECSPCRA